MTGFAVGWGVGLIVAVLLILAQKPPFLEAVAWVIGLPMLMGWWAEAAAPIEDDKP